MNNLILFANCDGNLIAAEAQTDTLNYSINFQMAKTEW